VASAVKDKKQEKPNDINKMSVSNSELEAKVSERGKMKIKKSQETNK